MKRVVSGLLNSQEMFQLEPPLTVNREFDSDEARAAAVHRHKRIGEFALTERTKGF